MKDALVLVRGNNDLLKVVKRKVRQHLALRIVHAVTVKNAVLMERFIDRPRVLVAIVETVRVAAVLFAELKNRIARGVDVLKIVKALTFVKNERRTVLIRAGRVLGRGKRPLALGVDYAPTIAAVQARIALKKRRKRLAVELAKGILTLGRNK